MDKVIKPKIEPLGDTAVLATFGNQISPHTQHDIQDFYNKISIAPFPWMVEAVPAYTGIAIYYDPLKLSGELNLYDKIKKDLESLFEEPTPYSTGINKHHIVHIPVCYGNGYGPDLLDVAKYNKLTPEEVIALHTEGEYLVYMIGFAPGFPYLGGMNKKITTPRKETPRLTIPAGSVGIAGAQTGVYPLESPGGWQIIGRTPLPLFRPQHKQPSLFKAGDIVRFYPISADEFALWDGDRDDH